jgi:hypothetical protein
MYARSPHIAAIEEQVEAYVVLRRELTSIAGRSLMETQYKYSGWRYISSVSSLLPAWSAGSLSGSYDRPRFFSTCAEASDAALSWRSHRKNVSPISITYFTTQ